MPLTSTAQAVRERPLDRRSAETQTFEHLGAYFTMTEGRYDDGRLCELFINAAHANSALDALASDAAIILSIALQFGADPETIKRALKRNTRGEPQSPIGAALDLCQQSSV
jgi:hypothetical protein